MNRDEILSRLRADVDELRAMGIASLDLFGSSARDERTGASDVDLLVEFAQPVGIFYFARVRRRLSEILGCKVDLVTRDAVRPEMRERIFQEAIHAA